MVRGEIQVLRPAAPRLVGLDTGGADPPILILHGLAGTSAEWLGPALALAPAFRVVVPDLRGHGESGRAPGRYTLADYGDDAVDLLRGLEQPSVVVGHSFGGQVAIVAASRAPALVRALVVIEAGPGPTEGASASIADWLEGWPEAFPDLETARAFLVSVGLHERWAENLLFDGTRFRRPFLVEDVVESARAQESVDLTGRWSNLGCPVLVVCAEHGFVAAELDEMLAAQPRARLATVRGAGHDVHLERPDDVLAAIQGFLRDLAAA